MMYKSTKVREGNYVSMKRLYDAYEINDGKFGCNITMLKLYKISKLFDKWELKVSYTHNNTKNKDKFDYEVEMSYDFFWNRPHAVLYYLG